MQINIRAGTYIYLALLVLFLPIDWIVAWLISVVFHEACHYSAVKWGGGEVYTLTLGISGAVMECSPLSDRHRLIALLCGPAGGFLLTLLGAWFPRISLCSWALTVFNLLPLLPLDGGKVMQLLLRNSRCFYALQKVTLLLLSIGAVYIAIVLGAGPLPVVLVAVLWIQNGKIPCKPEICKVQ